MEIDKKIFYCWFGEQDKPQEVLTYIATWKQYMPEYEIIEINETNFDISKYRYAQTAYVAKKYAFVSDCARIAFLQKYGGVYFDTDVEVRKDLTPLIKSIQGKILLSMEYFQFELTGVNTGVIVSEKNCMIWEDLLKYYLISDFIVTDEPQTINQYISHLLEKHTTFQYRDINQTVSYKSETVSIIPAQYLMKDTKQAFAVHHLSGTWKENLSFNRKIRRVIGLVLKKIIGRRNFERLWNNKKE